MQPAEVRRGTGRPTMTWRQTRESRIYATRAIIGAASGAVPSSARLPLSTGQKQMAQVSQIGGSLGKVAHVRYEREGLLQRYCAR
jgi:hypothetical protein